MPARKRNSAQRQNAARSTPVTPIDSPSTSSFNEDTLKEMNLSDDVLAWHQAETHRIASEIQARMDRALDEATSQARLSKEASEKEFAEIKSRMHAQHIRVEKIATENVELLTKSDKLGQELTANTRLQTADRQAYEAKIKRLSAEITSLAAANVVGTLDARDQRYEKLKSAFEKTLRSQRELDQGAVASGIALAKSQTQCARLQTELAALSAQLAEKEADEQQIARASAAAAAKPLPSPVTTSRDLASELDSLVESPSGTASPASPASASATAPPSSPAAPPTSPVAPSTTKFEVPPGGFGFEFASSAGTLTPAPADAPAKTFQFFAEHQPEAAFVGGAARLSFGDDKGKSSRRFSDSSSPLLVDCLTNMLSSTGFVTPAPLSTPLFGSGFSAAPAPAPVVRSLPVSVGVQTDGAQAAFARLRPRLPALLPVSDMKGVGLLFNTPGLRRFLVPLSARSRPTPSPLSARAPAPALGFSQVRELFSASPVAPVPASLPACVSSGTQADVSVLLGYANVATQATILYQSAETQTRSEVTSTSVQYTSEYQQAGTQVDASFLAIGESSFASLPSLLLYHSRANFFFSLDQPTIEYQSAGTQYELPLAPTGKFLPLLSPPLLLCMNSANMSSSLDKSAMAIFWAVVRALLAYALASATWVLSTLVRPRTAGQTLVSHLFWAVAGAALLHGVVQSEHAAYVPALQNRTLTSAVPHLLRDGPSLVKSCRGLVGGVLEVIGVADVMEGVVDLGRVAKGVCAPYEAVASS